MNPKNETTALSNEAKLLAFEVRSKNVIFAQEYFAFCKTSYSRTRWRGTLAEKAEAKAIYSAAFTAVMAAEARLDELTVFNP